MNEEIPEWYFGKAMKELDSYPDESLLAKCIALEGSTDAGRAKYIAKRAKQLFEQKLKEKEWEEEEEERRREKEEEARQYDEDLKRREEGFESPHPSGDLDEEGIDPWYH